VVGVEVEQGLEIGGNMARCGERVDEPHRQRCSRVCIVHPGSTKPLGHSTSERYMVLGRAQFEHRTQPSQKRRVMAMVVLPPDQYSISTAAVMHNHQSSPRDPQL
jgi:hypothetical protein